MAARLKALGVPALVIERNERIGDNWRKRYEALSLHFPHWAGEFRRITQSPRQRILTWAAITIDHLPYMPYPDHWPVYTPAAKLGDWLEWYASAMELYTWTDSNVTSCSQNETTGEWTLGIDRGGKENRTLHPKHVVSMSLTCIDGMISEIDNTLRMIRSWLHPLLAYLCYPRFLAWTLSRVRFVTLPPTTVRANGLARRSWSSEHLLPDSTLPTISLEGESTLQSCNARRHI
jgi:hypothetical protein